MIKQPRESCLRQLRDALQPWWMRLFLLLVTVLGACAFAGLRLNVSSSLPLGLYRVLNDTAAPTRGSVVVVCLPEAWTRFALQRQILGPGDCPGGSYGLGKLVVGVEGDVVTISQKGISVGDELLVNGQTLDRDRFGRPVPHHPWGSYALVSEEVWLHSCHPSAFDSRYFGPVATAGIRSIVEPILVETNWLQRACRTRADVE